MKDKGSKELRDSLIDVVEKQMRDNTPPETKQTFNRLLSEGYSDYDAKKLIAAIVSAEIFDVMESQKEFDNDRFVKRLTNLPNMPWE